MTTTNLAGAPAYNRPQMSSYYQQVGVGPSGGLVNSPPRQAMDMGIVNQQGNALRDSLMQQAQGQSVRMQNSLGARGFGSNSPVGIAQSNNMEMQARAAGGQAALQNRLQAMTANNQSQMQWDQTRRQDELSRMQMAMGLAGQDQQLYGQQLGYLGQQQQIQAEKEMQQKALENQLKLAGLDRAGIPANFGNPYSGASRLGNALTGSQNLYSSGMWQR